MAESIGSKDSGDAPGEWNAREIARRNQESGGRGSD